MITSEQVSACKAALLERQSKLIHLVQDNMGTNISLNNTVGELSNYDNHPGDMGTELYEKEKDFALDGHAENELEEINEALHAINEGTYGICSKCGIDIPYERLEAVPATDRCINHAKDNIFVRNRPVEEEVISPNINPNKEIGEDQVGYDAEDTWQAVSRYGTSETPSDFYGDRDNYNEMYPNSDENIGEVEDLEGFLSADIEGKYNGVTPNHNKYEDELDDESF